MAFPFAQHPTLNEFLRWLEREGFRTQSAVLNDDHGRPSSAVIVTKAGSDRHLIIVGMRESERLEPSLIAHYKRRLGLPFEIGADDGPADP
jgi:hypothetical protein